MIVTTTQFVLISKTVSCASVTTRMVSSVMVVTVKDLRMNATWELTGVIPSTVFVLIRLPHTSALVKTVTSETDTTATDH